MALPTALPALPTGLAGDPDASQEYTQALQKVLSSLEGRNKTNWFSIAGKLLQPGRTGNAYEGFGGAAEELGRQQEKQEEQEPTIAMMRAQVAGQQYQVKNESKALGLLADAMGTNTQTLATHLTNGTLPSNAISRVTPELLAATEYLSPKIGSIVKNVFDMELKTKQAVTEDLKAGTSIADLIGKYGKDKVLSVINPKALPASMQFEGQGTAPAPVAAPAPTATPTPAAMPTPGAAPTPATAPMPVAAPKPVAQNNIEENLPWATRGEIAKQRIETEDKPFHEKRAGIAQWDDQVINESNNRLKEIYDILDKKPHVVGLLKKQGLFSAFANAAQEGATMGQFGNISLPVETFVKSLNLKDADQRDAARVASLMKAEFLDRFKSYKSTLGPAISNADVQAGQAAFGATPQDSADAIKYWAQHGLLVNHHRAALFNANQKFSKEFGNDVSPQRFFDHPYYTETMNTYKPLYDQMLQRSPLYTRP